MLVLWRCWRSAGLYLLVYGALLTFWPWTPGRLLDVIIPLLMLEKRCGKLALETSFSPFTRVLRMLDAGDRAPDGAACQAVAAYRAAGAPRQTADP